MYPCLHIHLGNAETSFFFFFPRLVILFGEGIEGVLFLCWFFVWFVFVFSHAAQLAGS